MAKRIGRPPKKAAERRSNKLEVRLTPDERREVNEAARAAGIENVSEWARERLLQAARDFD